tara:strand:+ start:1291 stop:1656 length:366 start_codon:yes stop_codon:yes gene_type:complete
MPSKNKLRGTYYERKCVERAHKFDLKAERTWGSDGRSRGLHQEVDMVLEDSIHIQCKKRKRLAEHLMPIDEIHVQFVGEDRGRNLAIMSQDYYLSLIATIKECTNAKSKSKSKSKNKSRAD